VAQAISKQIERTDSHHPSRKIHSESIESVRMNLLKMSGYQILREVACQMELQDLKDKVKAIEHQLVDQPFVELHAFDREGRVLRVALTERLRRAARKEGVWRSREMLTTLKNAAYGFDELRSRSPGGRDGIFVMDRTFRPANEMMAKLFDRFLDKPASGADELATALGVSLIELIPVRLVSHHMRLLGVLARKEEADWLALVDCDRSE
jgi:hypothetical protein